jgi:hypothetical protein
MPRFVVDLFEGTVHIFPGTKRAPGKKRKYVHVLLRNSYFRCARGWAVEETGLACLPLKSLWDMMIGGALEVRVNNKLMNKHVTVHVRRPMAVVPGPNMSPLDDAFLCQAGDHVSVMGEMMQFIDPRLTVATLSSKSRGIRSRWDPETSLADRAIVTAHLVAFFAGEAREQDFMMSPNDF